MPGLSSLKKPTKKLLLIYWLLAVQGREEVAEIKRRLDKRHWAGRWSYELALLRPPEHTH